MVLRKTGTAVVLALLLLLLFAVPPAHASTTSQSTASPSHSAAPAHPSASCPQPDHHQDIRTLTPKERLDEGYPMPINKHGQVDFTNGKTDSRVDQIIHDKGVHFCSDTDVQTTFRSSIVGGESNNRIWSGNYADGGQDYTYAQMFWNVSCMAWGSNDYYFTWVGIGGVNNNNLVQTGVLGADSSAITHTYTAVIENVAASNPYAVSIFSVNCGDAMGAEIAAGNCMLVWDQTSGATSGWRCTGPNANSSTAECIVEAPTINGSIAYLSNYGTETLTGCQVEINAGSNQGINNVPHDYFNMYDGTTPLSTTGPISNGDTYTMTWHHYS